MCMVGMEVVSGQWLVVRPDCLIAFFCPLLTFSATTRYRIHQPIHVPYQIKLAHHTLTSADTQLSPQLDRIQQMLNRAAQFAIHFSIDKKPARLMRNEFSDRRQIA